MDLNQTLEYRNTYWTFICFYLFLCYNYLYLTSNKIVIQQDMPYELHGFTVCADPEAQLRILTTIPQRNSDDSYDFFRCFAFSFGTGML